LLAECAKTQQTFKNSSQFNGTPIQNMYVGDQILTCKAKKTGKIFCQSKKITSSSVLGVYAKRVFGVLSKYAK